MFDPTKEESALFSKLVGRTMRTVAFETTSMQFLYPGQFWLGPLQKSKGQVQYLTHSERVVSKGGSSDCASFVSYQLLDVAPKDEAVKALDKQWHEDMKAMGLEKVEVKHKKVNYAARLA
jgi:hypothetical protein